MKGYQEYYLRKHYSPEFKIKVCREHLETGASLRSLTIKYDLLSHSLIHEWLRRFNFIKDTKQESICNFNTNKSRMSKSTENSNSKDFELLQLEQRVKELEQQLKDAEMKAIAYSTMVDIAEKEFNIPIRKKYNTKPSKK